MNYCLPKFLADDFKQKLKSGEIKPDKLSEMTSAERRSFFTKILGEEHAQPTNALFESKLLLKNQQQGIINWAKTITGLKPEVQKDLLSTVSKMKEVLQPKELDAFLSDLAAKKLGVEVTTEEASKIAQMAKEAQDAKANIENGGDRLDYGRAKVAFMNYVNDLKEQAGKSTLAEKLKNPGELISNTAGTAKSLKASIDNSAIFRQGWKVLFTHPGVWAKNALKSFSDMVRTFGGKNVLDEVNADIVSRPNFDLMKKAKLAVGTIEEAFPTSLPEKIPGLGRAYKASEAAFTAFSHRTRADLFDKYLEIAKKAGVDVTERDQLESIGKLVNSLTGRGNLGGLEGAANTVNNIFFSPRFLKSQIDFLTAHQFQKGVTPFVRKQAALNLVKVIAANALILKTADAIKPGSVEWDPRSSDFGKIRIGDTRFDVSGGVASVLTLAAREALNSTKSSTTKKITELDSGKFGSPTSLSILGDFTVGKLAPLISTAVALKKGTGFNNEPINLKTKEGAINLAKNAVAPIAYTNYEELKNNPNSANILLSSIADALGISTNTYSAKKK